jgi:hypothetical protein
LGQLPLRSTGEELQRLVQIGLAGSVGADNYGQWFKLERDVPERSIACNPKFAQQHSLPGR